jgi:hypothetical protein
LPDPDDRAQAEARLEIIQKVFDYRNDPKRFGRLRLKDGAPVTSETRMIAYLAETTDNGISTIYRWLRRYNEGGAPDLARRTRSDKHTSRFFTKYPKAAYLAAYLFLECKQSRRNAFEAILRDSELIGVPQEDLPSYSTVRAFLSSLPPSLTVYAREGREAYRQRMSPKPPKKDRRAT